MSLLHVLLQAPCHGCRAPVLVVRTFRGIEVRGIWYDAMGRRQAPLHDCPATHAKQLEAFDVPRRPAA